MNINIQLYRTKKNHFNILFWFSEFCPGVPWKGLQNIDPETDPNVTPGSVPSGPTINTNIQDVNRYLLRDRSGGEDRVKGFWSMGWKRLLVMFFCCFPDLQVKHSESRLSMKS